MFRVLPKERHGRMERFNLPNRDPTVSMGVSDYPLVHMCMEWVITH